VGLANSSNLLDISAVFAGLLTVIVIGLIVENLIFRTIERNTVQTTPYRNGAPNRDQEENPRRTP
jgi:ABC-type nitrate/sulfonate/bicarbonate transport system permease component